MKTQKNCVNYPVRFLFTGIVATFLGTGCTTTPISADKPATATEQLTKPVFGKGGYYLDDGPDESPPPNLESVPDAIPKDEPPHRFANRPYDVLGSHYEPDLINKTYKQRGVASWYGRKFKGKKTASGELYDMYSMTAAHRTLPIPSYVRVTNPKNNRSVVVRVNDRGPFHPNRIIDLSYTAALKLGLISTGSGLVEVERIFAGDLLANEKLAKTPTATPQVIPSVATSTTPTPSTTPLPIATPIKELETTNAIAKPSINADVLATSANGLFIQLGAFGTLNGAENFREKIKQDLTWLSETIQILPRDGLFRVRLGPYPTRIEASAIANKIRETLDFTPHIATQ